jgi:hypothetical protein
VASAGEQVAVQGVEVAGAQILGTHSTEPGFDVPVEQPPVRVGRARLHPAELGLSIEVGLEQLVDGEL